MLSGGDEEDLYKLLEKRLHVGLSNCPKLAQYLLQTTRASSQ
jgi:hypothetical protein